MKKKRKISTLIFGILVAIIALSHSSLHAEGVERSEVTELKTNDIEMLEVIEQILNDQEFELALNTCMKIYNNKNQLVYECRDKDDEKIKILLRRSDLVLQTDSSSYYLLGD